MVKTWRQPKCLLTDEWIKKMWYMNTHVHAHTHTQIMEYYSAIKKDGTHEGEVDLKGNRKLLNI